MYNRLDKYSIESQIVTDMDEFETDQGSDIEDMTIEDFAESEYYGYGDTNNDKDAIKALKTFEGGKDGAVKYLKDHGETGVSSLKPTSIANRVYELRYEDLLDEMLENAGLDYSDNFVDTTVGDLADANEVDFEPSGLTIAAETQMEMAM